MARLSKAQHFEVYDDSRSPTPGPALPRAVGADMSPRTKSHSSRPVLDRQDSKYDSFPTGLTYLPLEDDDPDFLTVNEEDDGNDEEDEEDGDVDADDERRESAVTSGSISTMPDSVIHADLEHAFPVSRPYTPPSARPPFRRAESVRRMQMTSPTPFDRSPRRSVLARSRPGTPRSAPRSVRSPKTRKPRIEEEEVHGSMDRMAEAAKADDEDDDERRDFPLVLLHLTLLPVDLPWSAACMEAVLPRAVQDSLQTLRAKVSETILQRGILVPHPREDYELLEERLLEALELRRERVTKCGHFRARGSTCSTMSSSGAGSVDSGHGSSIEGSDDNDVCDVCCHRVKTSGSGVGPAGQRWTVKVFAANGLMRAAAWAAAWPEMERVDVEIVPWISDEYRKMLDAKAAEEEAEERRRAEEDRTFTRTAGELVWPSGEGTAERRYPSSPQVAFELERNLATQMLARMVTASGQYSTSPLSDMAHDQDQDDLAKAASDLPPIYRPSEIPLSLLLRNYVFLLAQDTRNVALLALTVIALWLSVHTAFTPAAATTINPTLELCSPLQVPEAALNATMDFLKAPGGAVANASAVKDAHLDAPALPQIATFTDETTNEVTGAVVADDPVRPEE